jgi:adiponectin receptor
MDKLLTMLRCHCLWNCTPAWAFYGTQLDYLGIILLMWSAAIPTIYYGFCCDADLQIAYWGLMTAAAIGCALFTMHPRFSQRRFRPCRLATYTGIALTAVVFVIHSVLLHGWSVQNKRMALDWMGWMALLNGIGAVVYVSRVSWSMNSVI